MLDLLIVPPCSTCNDASFSDFSFSLFFDFAATCFHGLELQWPGQVHEPAAVAEAVVGAAARVMGWSMFSPPVVL